MRQQSSNPERIDKLLRQIEEKKSLLKAKPPLTEGEVERFAEEFIIANTYNSNAIEGNTLTLRETAFVLEGLVVSGKPLKDHLEAVGHRDALEFILETAKNHVPLSEKLIRQVHSYILTAKREDRGVYRKRPVRILGAAHQPVEASQIESRMKELLENYENDRDHIITKLARFHVEFEGIHPFIDGNGRTGRLILNFELMKAGYPPIDIKFTDCNTYYEAFDQYFEKDDLNSMVLLLANYMNQQLDHYLTIATERQKLLKEKVTDSKN